MDHILVKFRPDTKITGRFKADFELEDDGELPEIRVKKFKVPPGKAIGLIRRLKQHLDVEDAEIDGEMQGIPMEVAEGNEWYQTKLGCLDAWKETTGLGAAVAVLDSGIDFSHPYLTGRQAEQACFVANETTVTDSDGHGTACAGLVLAIAKNAMLYNGRVMSANSAKWSAVAAGILWAKDRCKVISVSIGGTTDSFALIDAIMKAAEAGAVVLCAAGNAGTNTKAYPAATLGAYAVSATDENDNKAGFSQYGDWIDLSAPGTNLRTTTRGGGFGSFSGTSGSTPIAAGVVALSLAQSGGTGQDALSRVSNTAKKLLPATYFGAGRVDAAAAVGAKAVEPPPSTAKLNPPTIVSQTSTSVTFIPNAAGGLTDLLQGLDQLGKFNTVSDGSKPYTWAGLKHDGGSGGRYKLAVQRSGMPETLSDPVEFRIVAGDVPPPPPPPPPALTPLEQGILDAGLTGADADLARVINGVMPADTIIDGEPKLLAWHLTNGAIVALSPV